MSFLYVFKEEEEGEELRGGAVVSAVASRSKKVCTFLGTEQFKCKKNIKIKFFFTSIHCCNQLFSLQDCEKRAMSTVVSQQQGCGFNS